MHDFDEGLLMRVSYPKRSSSPLSNFLPGLINGALLIWKSRSNYWNVFFKEVIHCDVMFVTAYHR